MPSFLDLQPVSPLSLSKAQPLYTPNGTARLRDLPIYLCSPTKTSPTRTPLSDSKFATLRRRNASSPSQNVSAYQPRCMATSCLRSTLLHIDPLATIRRCPHVSPSQASPFSEHIADGAQETPAETLETESRPVRGDARPRRMLSRHSKELPPIPESAIGAGATHDGMQSLIHHVERFGPPLDTTPKSFCSVASSFDFAAFEENQLFPSLNEPSNATLQLPCAVFSEIVRLIDFGTVWTSMRYVSQGMRRLVEDILYNETYIQHLLSQHLCEVRLPYQHHWDLRRKHRSFDPLYRDIYCTVAGVVREAGSDEVQIKLQPSYKRQKMRLTMRSFQTGPLLKTVSFFKVGKGTPVGMTCDTGYGEGLVVCVDLRRVYTLIAAATSAA